MLMTRLLKKVCCLVNAVLYDVEQAVVVAEGIRT